MKKNELFFLKCYFKVITPPPFIFSACSSVAFCSSKLLEYAHCIVILTRCTLIEERNPWNCLRVCPLHPILLSTQLTTSLSFYPLISFCIEIIPKILSAFSYSDENVHNLGKGYCNFSDYADCSNE